MLYNDSMLPIYKSAIFNEEEGSNILFVIVYMILNWVFFVGVIMRIFLSVVGTTFHYAKFHANNSNKDKRMSIQNFLENELLKSNIDSLEDIEVMDEIESKKANILASLNHMALEDIINKLKLESANEEDFLLKKDVSRKIIKSLVKDFEDRNSKQIFYSTITQGLDTQMKLKSYFNLRRKLDENLNFILETLTKKRRALEAIGFFSKAKCEMELLTQKIKQLKIIERNS